MRKKKDKFLTFMFSLLPGAGHMYMGFMKMGISLMSAFFFTIFLSTWLNIPSLLFVMPVLWFYSFFDCINKSCASNEEFAAFNDNYLFSIGKLLSANNKLFDKRRLFAGILLFLLGIYLVWTNLIHLLHNQIPEELYDILNSLTRFAPQTLLGIAIVVAGIKLIMGKKKERDSDV